MQDLNSHATDNTQILSVRTENNPNAQCAKPRTQQCKYCTKKYKMLGALKKHEECCSLKSTADSEDDKDSLETQEEKQNACKDCGQTFKYAKILQKHEVMHKGKYPFWCKLCMINFATDEDKVLHKLHEHPSKGRKHKCKICQNKNFDTEEEYLFHINEVHKGKLDDYYMCSDCGKQFKTKSELTHHNNSKCGTIKQYQCKVCGQYLMTAGSLHNHMLRHTGEQGCMCWYCGKTFLTVGQLKVHERTHTQEKAFICDVCGKGFCHRQSLITHSTLHTGVKPYQCESCGHSFSCVGNLIKHRRTHADTCGKMPLTSHRVNNPSTKMKVKINTPESSKLKALKKEKELQEKLSAYKEKLNTKQNEPNQSESSTPNEDNVNYILSNVLPKQDDSTKFKLEVKSESNLVPPFTPDAFMQTKMFEIKDTELKEDYHVKHQTNVTVTPYSGECTRKELNNHKEPTTQLNNNVQNHCDNYANEQESELLNNWGYLSEDSSKIDGAYSIKHFPPDVNSATAFEGLNSTTDCENQKVLDNSQCHTECDVKNESCESNDDDEDHQFNDNYDSEDCNEEGSLQEIPKCNKTEYSKKQSKQHDKISEIELTRFIIRRGFGAGKNAEGNCQYCKKSYNNMRWLMRHEKEHENKIKYSKSKGTHKCSCCKLSFETREACKVHQQNVHADILTCQDCDKLFSNVDSLRSHQNIFHKGLPRKIYVYVCEKCGLQFRQKAFLSHHETNNCGTGPIYDCHVCGKGFNSVHTRRSHLRIHDPKKRFLCKFCGKSFRWKGQLKVHERSHTGEKPFKCLYCPKAFGYRESLVTHSSLHTGIKPHLCQACGSRFSCIGNLIKHRATHASSCGVWYSKNQ